MIGAEHNITVDADTDWYIYLLCQDVDGNTCNLTGYTGVVAHIGQTTDNVAATQIGASFVLLDESESSIQGDGAGIVKLSMTQSQFSGVDWQRGRYDVHVIEPAGTRTCLMRGQFIIRPAVAA